MLIFPPEILPQRKFSLTNTYKVRQAQFSGYKQVSPIGINNVDQKVELEFIVQGDQIDTLLNFFELTRGAIPFIFTLPHHQPAYWTNGPVSLSPVRDDLWSCKVSFTSFNQLVSPTTLVAIEENVGITVS